MQDRVGDVAVGQHERDAARDADQHRRRQHRLHAFEIGRSRAADAEPAEQAGDASGDEKPADSSLNPQPSATEPYTYAAIGAIAISEDQRVLRERLRDSGSVIGLRSRIAESAGSPSRFRAACHIVHATHRTTAATNIAHRSAAAGHRRQLRELHRDARLERIRRTERAADRRGAGAHRDDRDGVDAESAAEHEQRGNQRDDLLLHVLERAHRREEQRDDGNRDQAAAAERRDERGDEPAERADAIDHDPGGADEQHDGDDVRRFDEPARNRDDRGERTDGRGTTR